MNNIGTRNILTPHPTAEDNSTLYPPIPNPEKKAIRVSLFFPWTEQEQCQKEMEIVNSAFQKTLLYE